jgi:hypothetical protein
MGVGIPNVGKLKYNQDQDPELKSNSSKLTLYGNPNSTDITQRGADESERRGTLQRIGQAIH